MSRSSLAVNIFVLEVRGKQMTEMQQRLKKQKQNLHYNQGLEKSVCECTTPATNLEAQKITLGAVPSTVCILPPKWWQWSNSNAFPCLIHSNFCCNVWMGRSEFGKSNIETWIQCASTEQFELVLLLMVSFCMPLYKKKQIKGRSLLECCCWLCPAAEPHVLVPLKPQSDGHH